MFGTGSLHSVEQYIKPPTPFSLLIVVIYPSALPPRSTSISFPNSFPNSFLIPTYLSTMKLLLSFTTLVTIILTAVAALPSPSLNLSVKLPLMKKCGPTSPNSVCGPRCKTLVNGQQEYFPQCPVCLNGGCPCTVFTCELC